MRFLTALTARHNFIRVHEVDGICCAALRAVPEIGHLLAWRDELHAPILLPRRGGEQRFKPIAAAAEMVDGRLFSALPGQIINGFVCGQAPQENVALCRRHFNKLLTVARLTFYLYAAYHTADVSTGGRAIAARH